MANYQLLKEDIDAKVYQNGQQEITGVNLNSVLNEMVTTLGAGYQFAGVATKDTNPGTPDAKVFYIANGKGTYTNFGSLEVTEDEVVVLYWDSSWHKVSTGIASQEKLSELDSEVKNNPYGKTAYVSNTSSIGITNFNLDEGEVIKIKISGSVTWSRLIISYNGTYDASNINVLLDSSENVINKEQWYKVVAPKTITSVGLGFIKTDTTGDIRIDFERDNLLPEELDRNITVVEENLSVLRNALYGKEYSYHNENAEIGVVPCDFKQGEKIAITINGSVTWNTLLVTYNGTYNPNNPNVFVDSRNITITKGVPIIVTAPVDIYSVGLGFIKKDIDGNIDIKVEGDVGDLPKIQDEIKSLSAETLVQHTYDYYSDNGNKGVVSCNIKKGDYIKFVVSGTVEWNFIVITCNGTYSGSSQNVLLDSRTTNLSKGDIIEIFAPVDMDSIGIGFLSKKTDGNIHLKVDTKGKLNSKFKGKKITFFGHSIVQQGIWCKYVADYLEANMVNCGVGGTWITGSSAGSMCQMSRLRGEFGNIVDSNTGQTTVNGIAVPTDTDYVFIEAGVNDWAGHVNFGRLPINYSDDNLDVDTSTLYGACHQMFVNFSNHCPNATIIVVGDVFGKQKNRAGFNNSYGILNNVDKQTIEYGDALCEVAGLHGHKAFNIGRMVEVNDKNVMAMGDGLHPNIIQSGRIARVILENILSISL